MIPFIDDFIEMHERDELPPGMLVAYVVKKLSQEGSQLDYDSLPEWLKEGVRRRLAAYSVVKGWYVLMSNSEGEDYGPYAEDVVRRFDLDRERCD